MAIIRPDIGISKDDFTGGSSNNYTVDLDVLPINSSCATNFFCPAYGHTAVEVNKILWKYDSSPYNTTSTYFKYLPSGGSTKYFSGTIAQNINDWHVVFPLSDYFSYPNQPQFIARGSYPQFTKCLAKSTDYGLGNYTLKIVSNKLEVACPNGTVYFEADEFKDGIIPDRLLVVMSGAGGGGGANSGGLAGMIFPIAGADGGGGGSGAFVCAVINTRKLKESASNYFKIWVGSGGERGYPKVDSAHTQTGGGSAWWDGLSGSSGGATTIYINNTQLVSAGGGGGGSGAGTHGNITTASGGAAGTVTKHKNPGEDYWIVSSESGKKGGNARSGGPGTDEKTVYCVNTSKKAESINWIKVGGYSGGSWAGSSSGGSGGGAASYFGPGGNGGSNVNSCQGKAPSSGQGGGGGGARYHAYGSYAGGDGADGYLAIYY